MLGLDLAQSPPFDPRLHAASPPSCLCLKIRPPYLSVSFLQGLDLLCSLFFFFFLTPVPGISQGSAICRKKVVLDLSTPEYIRFLRLCLLSSKM